MQSTYTTKLNNQINQAPKGAFLWVKIMEIKLGVQYYFNNRPVIPVQKVKDAEFYLCVIELSAMDCITDNLTPDRFCTECMAGSGYSSHQCGTAGDILNALEEFVIGKDVIFVPAEMLKENYFEWQKNEELINSIKTKEEKLANLNAKLVEIDEEIKGLVVEQQKQTAELEKLLSIKNELLNKNNELSEENKGISAKTGELDIQVADGISIKLKELQSLYADSFKLRALEFGGVDNWTWYSESLGEQDYEELAIEHILGLKSN